MTSEGVDAVPEDIRRFAMQLKQFNTQLAESSKRLQAQFNQLGEGWQDQVHQKFAHEFEQTMRLLHRFQQISEQHIPLLLKKADDLDRYLGRR